VGSFKGVIMTSEELVALAKTHTEAILLNKLTKAEVIMLLALINARITQMMIPGSAPTSAPVSADKPLGQKLAEKGYPCVCVMCSEHVYTVSKDVYDGTTVADFINSYTPMPGYPLMSKQTKISNIEGNITMDCPKCGGELTLYLAGRKID
jgi:hypothetical protein